MLANRQSFRFTLFRVLVWVECISLRLCCFFFCFSFGFFMTELIIASGARLLSTAIYDFEQRDLSVTIEFFDVSYETRNVYFWPYKRYPWWTDPDRPGPTRTWGSLMGYASKSLKDTNLTFWHNSVTSCKNAVSNFIPKILFGFEIIAFLVERDFCNFFCQLCV